MNQYRNNPNEVLDYTVDYAPEKLENNLREVVKLITNNENVDSFQVKHLTGGNTNILYHVYNENELNEQQYIVRLYGIGTEDFIDRQIENIIFAELSKSEISPPFIGLFKNGRVEGYFKARSLLPDEFSDLSIGRSIAKALAKFQTISIDIDKHVGLWHKLHVFFSLAQENITHNRLPKLDSYSIQLDKMSQEALWLEQTVESIKSQLSSTSEGGEAAASDYMKGKLFAFNVVLCHNDVLSGNVLLHHSDSDSTSSSSSTAPPNNENETIFHKIPQTNDNVVEAADPHITLIDYEYSCYSYRAFDIANHFCEYAGFLFDIKNKFPSEFHRKEFERHFILQTLKQQQQQQSSQIPVQENNTISEEFLNGFDETIMKFVLVSHLFWGSWAVIQAAHSLIDFDFLEYAQKRFEGYYYHKEMITF